MIDIKQIAVNTINIEIESLTRGKEFINHGFIKAVEEIGSLNIGGRVVVMGMGKSGHIGNKIAATLASTGTPAFFVHPAEAGHGDLGMISENDIVVMISQSGKSEELLKLIPFFKRKGIKIIAMTGVLSSPLAVIADFLIETSVLKEACPLGLAPTSSTTLTLALGDALAICLLELRGFSSDDFAITHPNGLLGRKLLITVADIMSNLDDTPIINKFSSIKESIFEISTKGMGFVIITNEALKPIGIFTDGDLRRSLDKNLDLDNTKLENVMTKDFIKIESHKLCVEAIKIMSENKITMLPVIDTSGSLVGGLNMRQLLQSGVI
jgi:arabinose-5-phosphate isomerase